MWKNLNLPIWIFLHQSVFFLGRFLCFPKMWMLEKYILAAIEDMLRSITRELADIGKLTLFLGITTFVSCNADVTGSLGAQGTFSF